MKIVMVNGAAVLIGSESPPFAGKRGCTVLGINQNRNKLAGYGLRLDIWN
jgi:hypothetical protein